MQNSLRVGSNFWEEKSKTLVWKLKSKIMCFEKFLESFLCITCHEKSFENWFYRKISGFSKKKKKNCFFESRRLNLFFDQSKKVKFSKPDLLPSSIDVRLKLDWSKLKNFQFFKILTNLFFSCIIYDRIHVHSIVFSIHLAVLQLYLSFFSHITCKHFAKLGTQLDLKID